MRNQNLPPIKYYDGPRSLSRRANGMPASQLDQETPAQTREEMLAELQRLPRFDLERMDWARWEENLTEGAQKYKQIRQCRFDAENYAVVPIPHTMYELWEREEAEIKAVADPDEIALVDAYFADGNKVRNSTLGQGFKAKVLSE